MALSDLHKTKLENYQLALSIALITLKKEGDKNADAIITLRDLNEKIEEAIEDINFESECLKDLF
jgi:hypothetical protein